MDFFDMFSDNKNSQKPSVHPMKNHVHQQEDCEPVLAMSYIPKQEWGKTYEPQTGLEQGTIFPDLNFPFLGKAGVRK